MGSVTELQLTTATRAPTMALFYKIDGPPGFACELCEGDRGLTAVVHDALFGSSAKSGAMTVAEVAGAVKALKETGDLDFEDGWLALRHGVSEVSSFLMAKVKEAVEEESASDLLRYEQFNRANKAEAKYEQLRATILQMIGDVVALKSVVETG